MVSDVTFTAFSCILLMPSAMSLRLHQVAIVAWAAATDTADTITIGATAGAVPINIPELPTTTKRLSPAAVAVIADPRAALPTTLPNSLSV